MTAGGAPRGAERAWYVRERWRLFRRASAPSRTPDKARVFACPSCGAPLEGVLLARCRYCNKEVCNGEFDWIVRGVEVLERNPRGPMLTAETQEEGTDEPTVVAPDVRCAYAALTERDPSLLWPAFEARVGLVFNEFQRAWSARDLAAMRPFLSDNLFEVETYWIRAYEAQHLRNVTENARITRLELARVTSDRFFDSITVRLFAASLDYTVSAEPGKPELVCKVEPELEERAATASTGPSSEPRDRAGTRRATDRCARAAARRSRSTWRATALIAKRRSPPATSTGC